MKGADVIMPISSRIQDKLPALMVVSAAGDASRWHQLMQDELHRTGHLAESLLRSDALVVMIGRGFAETASRDANHEDPCFTLIRKALATRKMLFPVTVDGAPVPEPTVLPQGTKGLTDFQALSLRRESEIPGLVTRLVVAAKQTPPVRPSEQTGDRSVFVSYRRDDAWYWAIILARMLAVRLNTQSVFFDLATLAPGSRFGTEIEEKINRATDFVIVVGPSFLEVVGRGRRRIDVYNDYVRIEIRTALKGRKNFHVVLTPGAEMPNQQSLPRDIAPAFKEAHTLNLTDFNSADAVAGMIIRTTPPSDGQRPFKLEIFRTQPFRDQLPDHARHEHAIASAVQDLASLGWKPPGSLTGRHALVLTRPGYEGIRFRLDPEHCDLFLEEHGRNIQAFGIKHWIKREMFTLSPDSRFDMDVLRLPDRLLEAAENPIAHLERVGRMDLDAGSRPPVHPGHLDRLTRPLVQPSPRALQEQARGRARIHARGGLRLLEREHELPLKLGVTARAVAVHPLTGVFAVASSIGVLLFDPIRSSLQEFGLGGKVYALSYGLNGSLAVASNGCKLSVLNDNGVRLVDRRSPLTLWRQLWRAPSFKKLSWSADESRVACCSTDGMWMFHLDKQCYELIDSPLDAEYDFRGSSALFIPRCDDLAVISHSWHLWRVSKTTGQVQQHLDVSKVSEVFDAQPSLFEKGGLSMRCLALSPDGRLIAVGGNDAQLVLFETETLQPLAMHVWHEPIVSGWNGEVEALAFSPDGRLLATVGSDERLVLGEVESGDALAEGMLSPYEDGNVIVSPDLCWSLDGLRLAVVTRSGRVEIWHADAAVSPF